MTMTFLLLAAGFTSVLAAAPAAPLRYENPEYHYSFTVPEGWVSIPQDVLKTRGQSEGPAFGAPAPVAGFQAPDKSWFHVPAVVVTHLPEHGRRPADIFEELGHDSDIGKNGKTIVYDDRRGAVLVPEQMPSTDGGVIQRVAVFKPGTEGVVHLDFYFPFDNSPLATPELTPSLVQVLNTFRYEPGFAMNDLPPGERPLWEQARAFWREHPQNLFMILLGILLLVFSIVNGVQKAREKKKGM
jgi:hypothetical protein